MLKLRNSFRVQILHAKFYILSVFLSVCTLETNRKMAFGKCRPCKLGGFQCIFLFFKWLLLSSHFLFASSVVLKCNFIKFDIIVKFHTSINFEVKNCISTACSSGCKYCLSGKPSRSCELLHLTWAIPKGINENFGCPALACISLFSEQRPVSGGSSSGRGERVL